ncbi:MAG: hypothetical protein CM15mP77_2990 [Synechococcus sp.]|nr:MAG: hypothetical protein CM15mP77_2990 [Synechococcus sp.]
MVNRVSFFLVELRAGALEFKGGGAANLRDECALTFFLLVKVEIALKGFKFKI